MDESKRFITQKTGSFVCAFTLFAQFNDGGKFTYRGDRFTPDPEKMQEKLENLFKNRGNFMHTAIIYDNRKSAPENIVKKWVNGQLVVNNLR